MYRTPNNNGISPAPQVVFNTQNLLFSHQSTHKYNNSFQIQTQQDGGITTQHKQNYSAFPPPLNLSPLNASDQNKGVNQRIIQALQISTGAESPQMSVQFNSQQANDELMKLRNFIKKPSFKGGPHLSIPKAPNTTKFPIIQPSNSTQNINKAKLQIATDPFNQQYIEGRQNMILTPQAIYSLQNPTYMQYSNSYKHLEPQNQIMQPFTVIQNNQSQQRHEDQLQTQNLLHRYLEQQNLQQQVEFKRFSMNNNGNKSSPKASLSPQNIVPIQDVNKYISTQNQRKQAHQIGDMPIIKVSQVGPLIEQQLQILVAKDNQIEAFASQPAIKEDHEANDATRQNTGELYPPESISPNIPRESFSSRYEDFKSTTENQVKTQIQMEELKLITQALNQIVQPKMAQQIESVCNDKQQEIHDILKDIRGMLQLVKFKEISTHTSMTTEPVKRIGIVNKKSDGLDVAIQTEEQRPLIAPAERKSSAQHLSLFKPIEEKIPCRKWSGQQSKIEEVKQDLTFKQQEQMQVMVRESFNEAPKDSQIKPDNRLSLFKKSQKIEPQQVARLKDDRPSQSSISSVGPVSAVSPLSQVALEGLGFQSKQSQISKLNIIEQNTASPKNDSLFGLKKLSMSLNGNIPKQERYSLIRHDSEILLESSIPQSHIPAINSSNFQSTFKPHATHTISENGGSFSNFNKQQSIDFSVSNVTTDNELIKNIHKKNMLQQKYTSIKPDSSNTSPAKKIELVIKPQSQASLRSHFRDHRMPTGQIGLRNNALNVSLISKLSLHEEPIKRKETTVSVSAQQQQLGHPSFKDKTTKSKHNFTEKILFKIKPSSQIQKQVTQDNFTPVSKKAEKDFEQEVIKVTSGKVPPPPKGQKRFKDYIGGGGSKSSSVINEEQQESEEDYSTKRKRNKSSMKLKQQSMSPKKGSKSPQKSKFAKPKQQQDQKSPESKQENKISVVVQQPIEEKGSSPSVSMPRQSILKQSPKHISHVAPIDSQYQTKLPYSIFPSKPNIGILDDFDNQVEQVQPVLNMEWLEVGAGINLQNIARQDSNENYDAPINNLHIRAVENQMRMRNSQSELHLKQFGPGQHRFSFVQQDENKLKNSPSSKFSTSGMPISKQSSNRLTPASKQSSNSINSAQEAFKQKFMMTTGLKGTGGLQPGQMHGRFF
ncbi:hypothetical protein FGO68_gene16885 [Halteria grandinella]|uniref:Uncharacterized protein n=1 Tax=Halteria grandinella TaxID=5974 RepID=A0A8J8SY38_HALGN|nr:hypothetical protein FGO68_gene16885 [Halteria grandinella]